MAWTLQQQLAELSPGTQVVFVTAYNQYAIDAFEQGAVDYLLKPIEPKRLANTIERLQSRLLNGGPIRQNLQRLLPHSTKSYRNAMLKPL